MALTIDRLTDRARQDQVESLEREYFDWVNSELGSEFGIAQHRHHDRERPGRARDLSAAGRCRAARER